MLKAIHKNKFVFNDSRKNIVRNKIIYLITFKNIERN